MNPTPQPSPTVSPIEHLAHLSGRPAALVIGGLLIVIISYFLLFATHTGAEPPGRKDGWR